MSDKQKRRRLVRQVLQEVFVRSQEQLASRVAKRDVSCTQATLSRDLRDMGVSRERTPDGLRYVMDSRARYLAALQEVVGMEILDVRHNGAMVVVRTLAGRAQGVAAYLDEKNDPRVLGTVAGDDTVFIAPVELASIDALAGDILSLSDGA
ncbi:MAG: arginine repressor [Myxococcota bacterium]|nr:arginine repressor [Myxococcota bacterium]